MQKPSNDDWANILAEARMIAQTDRRSADEQQELHVAHGEKHQHGKDCWCQPEVHYVDPDTGVIVFEHRRIQ